MNHTSAESALAKALENARAANNVELEQRILQLLPEAIDGGEDPRQVLRDVEKTIEDYGEDAAPDLLYILFLRQAQARQLLGETEEALAGLQDAVQALPRNAALQRARVRATIVRFHTDAFNWEAAWRVLREGQQELASNQSSSDVSVREHSAAVLKLVEANIHYALGNDEAAMASYEHSAAMFEQFEDDPLAVTALEGYIDCAFILAIMPSSDTTARLHDLANGSLEYRRATDKEQEGIVSLAADRLFAAQNSLRQALSIVEGLHNFGRVRSSRNWYAEVLLRANHKMESLEQFVLAGGRKKASEVAREVVDALPLDSEDAERLSRRTIRTATEGDLHARGAALATLSVLADIVPDNAVTALSERLSTMDQWFSTMMEGRDQRSEAGRLVRTFAARFDNTQALRVGQALVRTIDRTDGFWTSYKEACLALATLIRVHPDIAEELDIPLDRVVALVDDVGNDLHDAMTLLVNLALVGHAEARAKALRILRDGTTIRHVGWRYLLNDTSDAEVAEAIRNILPSIKSSGRVSDLEEGSVVSVGLSPFVLQPFDLPEEVRVEATKALVETATDQRMLVMNREAALSILGSKAAQLDSEGRIRAIDALLGLSGGPNIDVHPMLSGFDSPISGLRMNMGNVEDIRAGAAETLLALSPWMRRHQRRMLMQLIERLRASREPSLELAIARGVKYFIPRVTAEINWWNVRLLLLLNANDPEVRRDAARSLGDSITEQGIVKAYDELRYTIASMANSPFVKDRIGAAYILVRAPEGSYWHSEDAGQLLERLRNDVSYSVRRTANTA